MVNFIFSQFLNKGCEDSSIIFLITFGVIAFFAILVASVNKIRDDKVFNYSEPIKKLKELNKKLDFNSLDASKFNKTFRKSSLTSLKNFNGFKEFTELVASNVDEIKELVNLSLKNGEIAREYESNIKKIKLTSKSELPKKIKFSYDSFQKREKRIFNSIIRNIPKTFKIKFSAIYTSKKGYRTTYYDVFFNHHDALCVLEKINHPDSVMHLVNSEKILIDANLGPFGGQSVTGFITKNAKILQVPFKKTEMTSLIFEDKEKLFEKENLSPGLVGTVVDYLSRFMLCHSFRKAFAVPSVGYNLKTIHKKDPLNFKDEILGLDDWSIISACKLCAYDYLIRTDIRNSINEEASIPDEKTIHNIRVMVNRVLALQDIKTNFQDCTLTFKHGYTGKISKGDADILSNNCLIDLKTSKSDIEKNDILQISIYYLLGKNSRKGIYKTMNSIGIFNPRLNVYHKFVVTKNESTRFDLLKRKIDVSC